MTAPAKRFAYSLLTIKSVNEDQRIIEGVATTPSTDRMGDVVEPEGAQFTLPLPLLWMHDSDCPVGHVTAAKVTKDGIRIVAQLVSVPEPGKLQDRLNEAWQSLKSGLVRGLSIGFLPLESAQIKDTWSYRYLSWDWMELSCVTIPANAEASILSIKSADQIIVREALAERQRRPVYLDRRDEPTPTPTRKPGAVYL